MRRAKHTQKDSTKKRQQRTNKIVHGLHGDKVTAAAAAAPATVNNKQREKNRLFPCCCTLYAIRAHQQPESTGQYGLRFLCVQTQ